MDADEQVAELLLQWEQAFQEGNDRPAAELCAQCPELTDRVAGEIGELKRMAWLDRWCAKPPEMDNDRADEQWAGRVLLDRYRLDAFVGDGGFGEVWRGYDKTLRRPVAVKLPKRKCPVISGDDPFLAEARRVAMLAHPGIVPVFDVGRDDTVYFIVSEYIEGCHLGEYARREQPNIKEIARIMADVADALAFAHNRGIIHRDIKPANILVNNQDRVFLADFGIAVAQAPAEDDSLRPAGTVAYMAPEQLRNESPPDRQTDVYALGVVLYELLTGQHPFPGRALDAMMHGRVGGPVPPSALNTNLSARWDAIIARSLAHDPAKRFASAETFAAACRADSARLPETGRVSLARIIAVVALTVGCLAAIGPGMAESGWARVVAVASLLVASIAWLVAIMSHGRAKKSTSVATVLETLPTVSSLRKGDWPERYQRFRVLREVGTFSPNHIPAIIDLLYIPSPECRSEVLDWLVAAGAAAVPGLMLALRESKASDHDFRKAVVIALARLGPVAVAARDVLNVAARDSYLENLVKHALASINRKRVNFQAIMYAGLIGAVFASAMAFAPGTVGVVAVLIMPLFVFFTVICFDFGGESFNLHSRLTLFVIMLSAALVLHYFGRIMSSGWDTALGNLAPIFHSK